MVWFECIFVNPFSRFQGLRDEPILIKSHNFTTLYTELNTDTNDINIKVKLIQSFTILLILVQV